MKTLYAYIRVSTVKQGERGSSLQEQQAAIESYAQRHGLTISRWFEERETAAKRGRAMFNTMLRALAKGEAAGVIIHKIDRSARNLRDWADLGDLIDRGVEVHFAHESIDLQSRGGRLSADIQAVVASDFIRNLRQEIRKGFLGRLKQGLYPRPAPLGYRNQGRGLPKVPDPITGPLVRRGFELYASGHYSLQTVGEELHRLGLRNGLGRRLSLNSIATMLHNLFYIGLMQIKGTGEMYEGIHEPLIRKSLFDQVQENLRGKKRNTGLKHVFLYRRLVRCDSCGFRLIAERQKGHTYYRCHTATCPTRCIREEAIADAIDDALSTITFSENDLELLGKRTYELIGLATESNDKVLAGLQLTRARIEERLQRAFDAYDEGLVDKEAFKERREKLLLEKADINEACEKLQGRNNELGAEGREILELLKRLSDKGKLINRLEKRDLLKEATSNLATREKELMIAWGSPYHLFSNTTNFRYGAPHRVTPRTAQRCGKRRTGGTPHRSIRKLARNLVRELMARQDPHVDKR